MLTAYLYTVLGLFGVSFAMNFAALFQDMPRRHKATAAWLLLVTLVMCAWTADLIKRV